MCIGWAGGSWAGGSESWEREIFDDWRRKSVEFRVFSLLHPATHKNMKPERLSQALSLTGASSSNSSASEFIIVPPSSSASIRVTARR